MNFLVEMFSRSSFIFQIFLWMFCYYVTLFVSLPHLIENLSSNKFLIEIFCLFTQMFLMICLVRSMYYASTVSSYLTKEDIEKLNKEDKKKCIEYKKEDSEICLETTSDEDKVLNSNILKLSHCKKCDNIRNIRDRHCSICGRCTIKFDHHCFILHNCIGRRNFHYFVSFVFISFLQSVSFLIINSSSLVIYYIHYIVLSSKEPSSDKLIFFGYELTDLFSLIGNFPIRAIIALVITIAGCIGIIVINIFNFNSIYLDETWTERKHKLKQDESIEKLKKEERSRYSPIVLFARNFKQIYETNSLFDVFWPEALKA